MQKKDPNKRSKRSKSLVTEMDRIRSTDIRLILVLWVTVGQFGFTFEVPLHDPELSFGTSAALGFELNARWQLNQKGKQKCSKASVEKVKSKEPFLKLS